MPSRIYQYFIEGKSNTAELAKAVKGDLDGVSKKLKDVGKAMSNMGKSMTVGVTLPIVGAATVAVKSASSLESAFAGVIKTTDGLTDSTGALNETGAALKQEFRDLAKVIPASVEDLMHIGELGGQLGVAKEDLTDFTETIAAMGVATNLSIEEAATQFAQLGNIMGTRDFERMGSTIVELGNNFATTEADISNFAQRISGAGKIAGLSTADVMGISAAFSSVGVQAEAGGTAVQKVLIGMNTAVATGSEDLAKFASAAGMSSEEFAAMWEDDASRAFTRFIMGLGDAGDDAITILQDLGLEDQRLVRSFLSLANAGDLLSDTVGMANDAWDDNTALSKEAGQRYATFESQMTMFKNVLKDVAATLGEILLPILRDMMQRIIPWLQKFQAFIQRLTPTQKRWALAIAGIAAALGPVLLILGKVVTLIGVMANPIGLAIAAIAGLVAGFIWLNKSSAPIARKFQEFRDRLIPTLVHAFQWLRDWVLNYLPYALNIFRTVWTSAWAAVKVAWDNTISVVLFGLRTALDYLKGLMGVIGKLLAGDWSGAWETFRDTIRQVVQNLTTLLGMRLRGAIDIVKALLGTDLPTAFETVKSVVADKLIPAISGAITTAWTWLTTEAPGKMLELGQNLWGIITGAFDWVKEKLLGTDELEIDPFAPERLARQTEQDQGLIGGLVDSINSMLSDVWDKISTTGTELGGKIATLLTNAWTVAKTTAVTAALNLVDLLFGKEGDEGPSRAEDLAGRIKALIADAWKSVKGVALSALEIVNGLFGTEAEDGPSRAEQLADRIRTLISDAWQSVKGVALSAIDIVSALFGGEAEEGPSRAEQLAEKIQTLIADAWKSVKSVALAGIDLVSTLFGSETENGPSRAQQLADRITGMVGEAWKLIKATGLGAINLIGELFGGEAEEGPSRAQQLADKITKLASDAWALVKRVGLGAINLVGELFGTESDDPDEKSRAQKLADKVGGLLTDAWGLITDTGATLGQAVSNIILKAWTWLKDNGTALVNKLYDVVAGHSILSDAWALITKNVGTLKVTLGEAIKGIISAAWGWVKEQAKASWNMILGIIFPEKEEGAAVTANDWLGLGTRIWTGIQGAWEWAKIQAKTLATTIWTKLMGFLFPTLAPEDVTAKDWNGLGTRIWSQILCAIAWVKVEAQQAAIDLLGLIMGDVAPETTPNQSVGERLRATLSAGLAWLGANYQTLTKKWMQLLADVAKAGTTLLESEEGQDIADMLGSAMGTIIGIGLTLIQAQAGLIAGAIAQLFMAITEDDAALGRLAVAMAKFLGRVIVAASKQIMNFAKVPGDTIGNAIAEPLLMKEGELSPFASAIQGFFQALDDLFFTELENGTFKFSFNLGTILKHAFGAADPLAGGATDLSKEGLFPRFGELLGQWWATMVAGWTSNPDWTAFDKEAGTGLKLGDILKHVFSNLLGGQDQETPEVGADSILGNIPAIDINFAAILGKLLGLGEVTEWAQITTAIGEKIKTGLPKLKIGDLLKAIFTNGTDVTGIAGAAAQTGAGIIDVSGLGKAAADSFAKGLGSFDAATSTDITGFKTDIEAEVGKIDLKSVGTDAAEGFEEGLKDPNVWNRITGFVDEKMNWLGSLFRKDTESQSPSKMTWRIASDVGMGFVGGLLETGPAIFNASSAVVQQAVGPLEGANNTIETTFSPILNVFDRIVSWLSTFASKLPDSTDMQGQAEIFEDIGDGFDSMAKALRNFMEIGKDLQSGALSESAMDQLSLRYTHFVMYIINWSEDVVNQLGGEKWGVQKIKDAKKQIDRFVAIIDGFLYDFTDVGKTKDIDVAAIDNYAELVKEFIIKAVELVDWVQSPEKYGGLELEDYELKLLASWAQSIADLFVLVGLNLGDIESSDIADYEAAATTYFDELMTFTKVAAKKLSATDAATLDSYKAASEIVGYVTAIAGLLGINLKIELPEEDPTEKVKLLLGYVESFLPFIIDAMDRIATEYDTAEEDAESALDIANRVGGKVSAAFSVLSTGITAEPPTENPVKNIKTLLRFIGAALPYLVPKLEEFDRDWGTALDKVQSIGGKISTAFGVLGTQLKVELPEGNFMADLALYLQDLVAAAPLVFQALDDVMNAVTAPEGVTAEDYLQDLAERAGWIGQIFDVLGIAGQLSELEERKTQGAALVKLVTSVMDDLVALTPIVTGKLGEIDADAVSAVQEAATNLASLFETIAQTIGYISDILFNEELSLADLQAVFQAFIDFINSPGLLPMLAGAGLYNGPTPTDPQPAPPPGPNAARGPNPNGTPTQIIRIELGTKEFDAWTMERQIDVALGVDRRIHEFEVEV